MVSKELEGNKQLGHITDTEEKEALNGEQLKNGENICYTCLFGAVLGVSALAIGYLVLLTSYAYAIP